jgi:predicted membrane channel-forming protein YqfA (hemolysin III family)
MHFDLRLPIGLLFSLFGAIVAIYGLVTPAEMYACSLGINVNLWWGVVMFIFGASMLALAMASRCKGDKTGNESKGSA